MSQWWCTDWKPIPVFKVDTNPPWIWHGYYIIRYIFWQSVISISYSCHTPFSTKIYLDIPTDFLVYPNLKKLHLVYTRYIFSCHMPYLSMSIPCHKFVMLSCSGPITKFSRKLHCGSSSAYHLSAFIKHNKIYLTTRDRARRLLLCPRPWVGTPPARAPARRRTPPARGPHARGQARQRGP